MDMVPKVTSLLLMVLFVKLRNDLKNCTRTMLENYSLYD